MRLEDEKVFEILFWARLSLQIVELAGVGLRGVPNPHTLRRSRAILSDFRVFGYKVTSKNEYVLSQRSSEHVSSLHHR